METCSGPAPRQLAACYQYEHIYRNNVPAPVLERGWLHIVCVMERDQIRSEGTPVPRDPLIPAVEQLRRGPGEARSARRLGPVPEFANKQRPPPPMAVVQWAA